MSDYGYLMLIAMITSCVVLFAALATAACVTLARRHRLRHHHHHRDDPMSLQCRHATCSHSCSLSQLGIYTPLLFCTAVGDWRGASRLCGDRRGASVQRPATAGEAVALDLF